MALLDTFVVADAPLQSVNTEVYIALRDDLKNDATRLGSGKPDDPYDGSKVGSTWKFDTVIGLLPAGTSIVLGPGTFLTRGAWLLDGMRIVGAGRDVTTIQLDNTNTWALGSSGVSLTGVEVGDLCIDCQQQGGAINLTGLNNSFRNLRVINWAPNTATSRVIAQIANADSTHIARNCLLENCLFDSPGTFASGASATVVKLAGTVSGTGPYTYYPHDFCTVRGCQFDGVSSANAVQAIDTGLGRGFIAEQNQFRNVHIGVYSSGAAAMDVVIWSNAFYLVGYGVSLNYASSSPTFGRAVIMDNDIILPGGTAATAILVAGTSNGQYFDQVVVRNNEISVDLGSGSTSLLTGIQVFNAKLVNLENNVINDYGTGPADAVSVQYCTTVKAFNNLNAVGQVLRVYDIIAGRNLLELEDFIEDSILGL